jgi:O-antigen/teichoic acid export membrane protein
MSESSDPANEKTRNFNNIIDGAASFFIGNLSNKVINFSVVVLMTRMLSAESFGVFTFVGSVVGSLVILGKLGVDKALLRFIPKYSANNKKQQIILTVAIVVSVIGIFLAAGVMIVFKNIYQGDISYNPQFDTVFNIFIFILACKILLKTATTVVRSLEYPKLQIVSKDLLQPLFRGVGIVGALYLGYSIVGVAFGITIGLCLALLLTLYIIIQYIGLKLSSKIRFRDFREFLRFSLPVTLQDSGTILYKHIDILMVGWLLTSSDVAIYKVAYVATAYFTLPLVAFAQIFTPVASRLYENDELTELESIFKIITRWTITIVLFPSVVGILYRKELLSIFGQVYSEAGIMVVIFIISSLVVCGTGVSGNMLLMTDNQYYELANAWVFGVLNVLLNYVLILNLGVIGATIATSTTTVLSNITASVQLWYLEGISPISKKLIKPIIASIPAFVVTYFLSQQYYGIIGLVGGSILGFAIYATTIYILGIPNQDKKLISHYFQ